VEELDRPALAEDAQCAAAAVRLDEPEHPGERANGDQGERI
jgi:hypothetical protein